ncbi:MAG: hypothetical protein NTZ72_00075, partial [Afipia sp.]|nr:hypothetical protein [Afipia sp.]
LAAMTLVVARIDGPRVAVVADTLLTEHEKPLSFQNGVVKSCMLPGNICVSFANSPVTAERAFRLFVQNYPQGAGFAAVVAYFETSSRETGNDYIVAFANPARLVKIADGKRQTSLAKTLWIGDPIAYSRFREFEQPNRRKPQHGRALNVAYFADELKDSPASDLFSTMRNVVADPSILSAGGFVSVISNRDNGFRYSVYCDMLYDWPGSQDENYEFAITDQISLQTSGENTGFSIAQISPGFMGMNLTAFYYVKARKLFFFYGDNYGLANKCNVFTNVEPMRIHEVLNAFLRVDLKWLVTVTSPRDGGPYDKNRSDIKTPGSKMAFMVNANTFPKPSPS